MKEKTTHHSHKYQGKNIPAKEVSFTLKNNTPGMQGWLTIRIATNINLLRDQKRKILLSP